MTDEEKENFEDLVYRMENEGFDYCFVHYSNWDEVEDAEFHRLRNNYLDSMNSLKQYITEKYNEIDED